MPPPEEPVRPVVLILILTLPWAGLVLAGASQIQFVEEAWLVLHVQPLLLEDGESGALPGKRLEIDPEEGGSLRIRLQWPVPEASSRLELRATGRPGPPDSVHAVALEAELALPDGRRSTTRRALQLQEGTTSLIEVYREGARGLTLAITAERQVRPRVRPARTFGDPVLFRLEVDAVRGEQTVALETNHLTTFMNEPVEYSFRRGEGEMAESVRLLMTPVRRDGDVIEVQVEISGSLPGETARVLLSRTHTLVTSRGATSAVTVTSGKPPVGYRFRITPDYRP